MLGLEPSEFIIPLVSFNNASFVKQLGEALSEDGHKYVVLPKNKYVHTEITSKLSSDKVLDPVESYTPEKELSLLLDKYGIESSRSFIFPDMVYNYDYISPEYSYYQPNRNIPYREYETKLHKWLDKIDSLYESGGYIPIQNQGGEIFRRCLHTVATYHDYTAVWNGFSPAERMCGLHKNSKMYFDSLDHVSHEELSIEEKKDAMKLIQQITSEYSQYTGTKKTFRQNLSQKIQAFRNYGSSSAGPTISWLRESLLTDLKRRYFDRLYMDVTESTAFVEDKSFVYFPIQYFRESRVTYRSDAFYNQLWLIEYLSRSMPHGQELAIKDHPNQIGAQPLTVPRKLTRVANPLAADLNSRKIIENSEAVVSLNNTVGFEALMYGKPVVTLGSGFYAKSDYVYSVDNISNLESVLYRAVESDGLSDEEIIEVAAGILRESYPGRWGDSSDSNISKLSKSIQQFLTEKTFI